MRNFILHFIFSIQSLEVAHGGGGRHPFLVFAAFRPRHPPLASPQRLGPWGLGMVVLTLLCGALALANRKSGCANGVAGFCLQLPLVYSLFGRKKRSCCLGDELDAKDGN